MGMIQNEDIKAPAFKKPDASQFVPPEVKEVVDRVVAAGVKIIYSPAMREQVMAQVRDPRPPAQKMAESVVGLVLTLDQRTKGGIPIAALFPIELELLGEAAEVLTAAKQPITQADYNEAAQRAFALTAKKLGATDQQVVQGLQQHLKGAA